MNETLRRAWPTTLTVLVALLYLWIGLAAHGADRALGTAGGVVILAALVAAPRSQPVALLLLVGGAAPLAIGTWWSIVTPALALVVLVLGWFAIRDLGRVRTPRVAEPAAA